MTIHRSDVVDAVAAETVGLGVVAVIVAAAAGAAALTHLNWRGTVMVVPVVAALLILALTAVAWWPLLWAVLCGAVREYWRYQDIAKGQDKSRRAREAIGPRALLRNTRDRRRLTHGTFRKPGAYPIGTDLAGAVVCLPLGMTGGRHSLVIGATGSGKTTTLLAAAAAHLDAGCGVIAIDPKGDPALVARLRTMARKADRRFHCFSLTADSGRWNPLAHGTPSEQADKLIAAEEWTEPHYKRLYQRYLLTAFTAIDAREETADLGTVARLLQPDRLALYGRDIEEGPATDLLDRYLAELTDQERRDLAGLRNRIALLADGEHGHLLQPTEEDRAIDLLSAISAGDVVVFSLNTSRYPETAGLLGAALFQDFKQVAGILETEPDLQQPALVVVDEFSAFGQDHILALFQRARSAGLSLMLATQELADLRRVDPAFQDQILGNVETLIAHRQNVPDSAELVAQLAGTRDVWIHTFETDNRLSEYPKRGTRRRGHEFYVAPDAIKQQNVGRAVIVTKNPHRARRVKIYRPNTPAVRSTSVLPLPSRRYKTKRRRYSRWSTEQVPANSPRDTASPSA